MKYIYLLCFILISISLIGQESFEDGGGIKPPQAADFIKYGNIPVNKYLGQLGLNIPIYQYQDHNFNIPISISYQGAGFDPNKMSTEIGLHWYLNAGGQITRSVRGLLPDDIKTNAEDGFLVGTRKNGYDENDVFNFDSNVYTERDEVFGSHFLLGGPTLSNDDLYEGESDLYSFNFLNYSGKFIIDNLGEAKVISGDYVKINLEGIQGHWRHALPNSSEIVITTSDGNKYYFGGDNIENSGYVEYSSVLLDESRAASDNFTLYAWNLRKIEAPSGRVALFHYEKSILPQYNGSYYKTINFDETYTGNCTLCGTNSSGNRQVEKQIQAFFVSSLHKIIIEDFTFEFNYIKREIGFYPDTFYSFSNSFGKEGYRLDNMKYYYKERPLNSWFLKHSYRDRRMILDQLEEAGKSPYIFEYNSNRVLPTPPTKAIDHWGYWNEVSNPELVPGVYYNSNSEVNPGDYYFTSTSRDPCDLCFDETLLSSIIYPTGGSSEFTYDRHKYSKRLNRKYADNFMPKLELVSGYVGGARLKMQKDIDSNSKEIVKEYFYVDDYVNNSEVSSGILYNWPRYHYYWTMSQDGIWTEHVRYKSTSFNKNSQDSYNIGYSTVTEKIGDKITISHFSDYTTNPDNNDIGIKSGSTQGYVIAPLWLYRNYNSLLFNDMSNERGKLLKEQYFNEQRLLVSEKEYHYDTDLLRLNNFSTSLRTSGSVAQVYKNYIYNYKPITIESILFSQAYPEDFSKALVSSIEYKYDNNTWNVKEINSNGGSGEIITKEFKYPDDYTTEFGSAVLRLYDMFGVNLEEIKYRNGVEIENNAFEYSKENNIPVLKYLYHSFNGSTPRQVMLYENYNDKGLPIEIHKMDDANFINVTSLIRDSDGLSISISNAKLSLGEVAFSNFENNEIGNWNMSLGQSIGNISLGVDNINPIKSFDPTPSNTQYIDISYSTSGNPDPLAKGNPYITLLRNGGLNFRQEITSNTGVINNISIDNANWTIQLDLAPDGEAFEASTSYNAYIDNVVNFSSYSKTGENSLDLSSIENLYIKNISSNKEYLLNYWRYSGTTTLNVVGGALLETNVIATEGGWQLVEHKVIINEPTNNVSIMGTGIIDDLRFYPKNSFMTTYTYLPLIGITSETDKNNKVKFYEYDLYNRLKYIKDFEGNILQKYDYHYQNQVDTQN